MWELDIRLCGIYVSHTTPYVSLLLYLLVYICSAQVWELDIDNRMFTAEGAGVCVCVCLCMCVQVVPVAASLSAFVSYGPS